MTLRKPSLRSAVSPFLVMDMLRSANEMEARGENVVHMEVGQPAGPPPKRAIEAAQNILSGGTIGYTEALGLPALRERIAQHYKQDYGMNVPAERVVITTGSSGAFILSFLAMFDVGARVALPEPGYPAYRNILSALGIEVVPFSLNAADRWAPTAAAIRAIADSENIDGVLIASPANPTGTMIPPEELSAIGKLCAERNIWLISDEIYHRLTYSLRADCALRFNDDAVIINSFSKYYCMTGWRVGWMIAPERLVRPLECLAQSLFISPPALSQHAALAVFDATEELDARRDVYARNRELLLNELPGLGFEDFTPVDGAFYVYANVSRFSNDSFAFAAKMLSEAGVAATPGADFDAQDGRQFLRMSFAGSHEEMLEAVRRLRNWLR